MIEFTTGEVTTSGAGSLAINAFYRRNPTYEEKPLHIAEADAKSGLRAGRDVIVETVPSGNPRLQKTWVTRRHDLPNGSILKFVIRKHKPGMSWGASMCAIILRGNENAPLRRITIDLPFTDGCTKSRLYIEGRYDRLDEESYSEMGLKSKDDLQQLEHAEDADFIHEAVLEKGKGADATVKRKKVDGKIVSRVKRIRRVGLID